MSNGADWSFAEELRLAALYTARDGALMPVLVTQINAEFGHARPARSLKAVKDKVTALGLKRHPARRIEILMFNRKNPRPASALKGGERPIIAHEWRLPPDAFRDVDAATLTRERLLPGAEQRVVRPSPDMSLVGCAADLAVA